MLIFKMAPRDKLKTERNKLIKSMTAELRLLQPLVLKEARLENEQRLNAIIGSKADEFIDLKNAIISTPEEYVTIWMEGLTGSCARTPGNSKYNIFFDIVKQSENYQRYLHLFLRRSFLNHYEELYRTRPTVDAAEVWIGQNNANYGLLVTPRFGPGGWENDKSEIRRFKPRYWSIGHVLETGLVVPGRDEKVPFRTVGDYLTFFKNVLVRAAASSHQDAVADRYCRFVEASDRAQDVPLLIPEFRYNGALSRHTYRLDFTVIHPFTMDKVGFELSPWSSHRRIAGTKTKTQAQINAEASAQATAEAAKQKAFFKRHGVTVLIYTDPDLANPDQLFSEIAVHLNPDSAPEQYGFKDFADYFA